MGPVALCSTVFSNIHVLYFVIHQDLVFWIGTVPLNSTTTTYLPLQNVCEHVTYHISTIVVMPLCLILYLVICRILNLHHPNVVELSSLKN